MTQNELNQIEDFVEWERFYAAAEAVAHVGVVITQNVESEDVMLEMLRSQYVRPNATNVFWGIAILEK